jgi:prepilin-type processing-associated H-X9-DG protein
VYLDMLNCPSDQPNGANNNRSSNYVFSQGDGPTVGSQSPTTPRGIFGYQRCYGVRDILDGTSNTIAMSEKVKGNWAGGAPGTGWDATGGAQKVQGTAASQPGVATSPALCYSTVNGTNYKVGINTKAKSGTLWTDGQIERVAFHTILPPNGPSCTEDDNGNADSANTVMTATSRHTGGVHTLMADGAVRFVSDNINSGNTSAAPVTGNATSPYGTWGALGSMSGGEPIGEF